MGIIYTANWVNGSLQAGFGEVPTGGDGAKFLDNSPVFRLLVAADIPVIPLTKIAVAAANSKLVGSGAMTVVRSSST